MTYQSQYLFRSVWDYHCNNTKIAWTKSKETRKRLKQKQREGKRVDCVDSTLYGPHGGWMHFAKNSSDNTWIAFFYTVHPKDVFKWQR